MIKYEKEVCHYLCIPSIPKKEWDGQKSFKYGIAVIGGMYGDAYAIATFDAEKDKEPRIVKVFDCVPFNNVGTIYIVPSYIDNDVSGWDVDEKSKQAAQEIIKEANDLAVESKAAIQTPDNEYFFEHITNDEEARAYIKSYNQSNKIGGRVPTNHDSIVLRLGVIWAEQNKKK